ncbi:protein of unknown function [Thermomonospora echinospora]|uniref:DUF4397 domain-containing protein n=1 Tax=Thermomonospora echinospora TaxID=1992 RepID=A0A1H6DEV1_9ACTN|nr:DUF4397 domain-containing protein [Thermomonospora echinospora]SEG83957.1 protein of unknown function [Thermomonospora echinospora]
MMREPAKTHRSGAAVLTAVTLGMITAAAPATATTSASRPGAPGVSAQGTATVSVLHGVPGATVDVYANGKKLLSNFTPGSLSSPQKLPAGSYDIKVLKAGENPGATPLVSKTVQVADGSNDTITAHLNEGGQPAITAFVNDTSKVPAGKARLTLRHIAAAPAVDVRADGKPVVRNLANPGQAELEVPAKKVRADVVLAGTGNVVAGPADLNPSEGSDTIVYAWGSARDKNIKLAVQSIKGMQTAPGRVPAGSGGQAAGPDGGAPGWMYGLTGLAMLVVVGAGSRLLILRRPG